MSTEQHPGLSLRTIDVATHDVEGPDRPRLVGWGEALARGFHQGRLTDDARRVWLEGARADAVRVTGFWPERSAVASTDVPVATYASWTGGGLNVGGGRSLPLHMITDITVSPTHRRRGLLSSMLRGDLEEAAGRGMALAGLTVTEGGIYGRFGFGPATRLRTVDVDVSERFRLRPFSDEGSLELVEPSEAWEALHAVHRQHRATTRGALAWPAFYEAFLTGRFSWEEKGPDRKSRVVLHLDADGRPDGYAVWTHRGEQDGVPTVDVADVVCTDPDGYLALWQFLAGIDLTRRVRWRRAPLVDPLEWSLADPRCVRTTGVGDLLWVRVLDVVTALEARPWYADGTIVLGLDDPLGLVDGGWRVAVSGGRATVTRSQEAPDVALAAETLGALYLGGVDTPTLTAARRLVGQQEALARWAAMVDGGPAPYCTTGF